MATKVKAPFRVFRAVAITEHPSAECVDTDCMWARGPSEGTLAAAKEHVATTGHQVLVEASTRSMYRGTPTRQG